MYGTLEMSEMIYARDEGNDSRRMDDSRTEAAQRSMRLGEGHASDEGNVSRRMKPPNAACG